MTTHDRLEDPPIPLGVISALVADGKREGRVVVKVGREPVAIVNAEVVIRLGLAAGTVLTPSLGAQLVEEAAVLRTYDKALDLLAVAPRSSHDLALKLRQRAHAPAHIERAFARLTELGLLDDATYARQVAETKLRGKGLSPRGLRNELYKKGIRGETATEAIAEVLADSTVDTQAIVHAAAEKKLRTMRGLDRRTQRQRLYAFLARRQYEHEDIQQVLRALLDGDDVAGDDLAGEATP